MTANLEEAPSDETASPGARILRVFPKAPLARCGDCPLRDRPFVPGSEPPMTDRIIVGEAPGHREVVEGRPFVAKAGGRLNEALSAAEVDRLAVHIHEHDSLSSRRNESPPRPERSRRVTND